jgi:hypothetical protein
VPELTWILAIGTQVVSRVEIRDARGNVVGPTGAVGTPLVEHAAPIAPAALNDFLLRLRKGV